MKLHEFFFWLLVFFLPTQLGRHFWPDFSLVFGLRVDYLSPIIYLTDLLVAGVLFSWFWAERKKIRILGIRWFKKYWWVGAIFVYFLLTSLLSKNPGAALYKFAKIIEFSLLGLYIAKNRISLSIIHHPLSIAVIYSSLIAIFQFFKQASLGGIFYWLGERSFNIQTPGIALGEIWGRQFLRPYSIFSHPNSLAGFMLVSLILILAFSGKRLASSKIKWAATGLGTVVILLSFSRAVWLVGALLGLFTKRKFLLFTFYFLLFTIFFVASLPGISEKPVQERIQLIKFSLEMIKSNPILGVGLNNFIVRLPEYWQSGQIRLLQPVHNIYLLILAETGLVGLIIFLWFLVLTFRKLLEIGSWKLVIPLMAILLTGVADHYWFTLQQNQLLATIIFSLAWSKIKS
ncbi:hypothetical protein COU95_02330 [Candidatus Shapirobacteria bacterium CG10_big_fil_rev_8_21_14_0_10_40_9]|uniref:O-antigen ligase-related domain-containing protein n=1 Tax=Candidatus Shapirobacteria bacterium CG10_big_fil_rev_8_21_14_0_10_40_9 TaxID=1974888 RepID=A0A2M8L3E4_9BACT|nr:MAG: hypothetical protein COU95_02330 [Candidatus Shapirobacteria bacterium CG10_big_fil_rev_8_21_14_0_10_40_9]